MLIGALQWIFDEIGKLGPLAVAVAVFLTGRRQSRWMNQATARAAAIEDQKLRLAMLDRRLRVMDHLRKARDQLVALQSGDALGAALDALREAELVFEDHERQQLRSCLDIVLNYQNRFFGRLGNLNGDELMEAARQHTSCSQHISAVLEELRRAARVQNVAPLPPPN